MNAPQGPVAPASDEIPTFEELASDPEIAALLDFEPVPMRKKVNGWDPDAQRAFVTLLAMTGSRLRAARAIGRNPAGIDHVLTKPEAVGFAAAIDGAMALAAKRNGRALAKGVAAAQKAEPTVQAPGQVMNELGEWEDEESYLRRADEAKDTIGEKLRRARRLFLYDISFCPAKRAAFEILAEWPVDWEIAARGLPQPDEPWHRTNLREPDMLLTAEAGFLGAPLVHGPDRRAELLAEINEWRVEQGLEAVRWDEAPLPSPPSGGEGGSRSQPGEGCDQ